MKEILLFVITFIIIYLIYFIFVISRKKALLKWKNGKELTYLKKVYKIKIPKNRLKLIANVIALSNSFIVASTLSIVSIFKNFLFQMLIGFFVLCGLIVLIYHIIGKSFQKINRKENKHV